MIDWKNPDCQVTPNFSVKDALWLGQWRRLANASDGLTEAICDQLELTCLNAERVRKLLACRMLISSMWRPAAYSPLVGGSSTDVHVQALAFDFVPDSILSINAAKALILPQLDDLELRMEQDTTNWIHIDSHTVGPSGRYFIP